MQEENYPCLTIRRIYCWIADCIIHILRRSCWFCYFSSNLRLFNGFPDSTDVLTKIGVEDYKKVWEDQIRFAGVERWLWAVFTLCGQCGKLSLKA